MGMESTRHAELLAHEAFVRRLARDLVRDAAAAEDLAQEAWVRALERPPGISAARANALGRFEFRDVPACPVFVRIDGQGEGAHVDLPPESPRRDLRVEIALMGAFTLEILDPTRAPDALRVLGDDGEWLRMERDTGAGSSEGGREIDLPPEGAIGWRDSERAQWLVLLADDAELARLPIRVRRGRTARLVW